MGVPPHPPATSPRLLPAPPPRRPCHACKPAKLRTDPDCKETGFTNRLACVVGLKGQDVPHEYGRELDPDQTTLKEGKRVSWQHSCQPPGGLSFVGFEGTVLTVLLLAYVVMMRRKRALQRL